MDPYDNPKELIVSLQDVDTLVEGLEKRLVALFVEVDHELVDVLVQADPEHFAVVPYKALRTIKFTLRNLLRHENLGDTRLKMSLLNSFDKSYEHTLYFDGYEKYRLTDQTVYDKPSAKLLYEWRDPDPMPDKDVFDGTNFVPAIVERSQVDIERRMRQAETDLQYVIRDLIESLKKDAKESEIENSAKTQELENQLLQLIQVADFKETTVKQTDKSGNILEAAHEFARAEEGNLRNDIDSLTAQAREIDGQLRVLEESVNKESLIQKQMESSIANGSCIVVSPDVKRNTDARRAGKEEVYRITKEIESKTLENVKKMKEDATLAGLEQTKVKVALFDDALIQEGKVKDSKAKLEAVKTEVRNNQALLASKEFDLMLLEQESKKLAQTDRDLGSRIRESDEALQAMLADRKDATDRGNELEEKAREYETLLAQIEKEVNQLKSEVSENSSKNTKGLFNNLGANNPEIKKLQGDLTQAEKDRDLALSKLEKMEGAWIESVEEVSKEAEKLVADSGDVKFRKEVDQLLKDIVDTSHRSAELYQTFEVTDQQINLYKVIDHSQLAADFSKDVTERNTHLLNEENVVKTEINKGVNELNTKHAAVEKEQNKIPSLQQKLEELLNQRAEYEASLDELIQRKQIRDEEDAERERKYQRDLAAYNKRIEEINREIISIKEQIKEISKSIERLQPQVNDLKVEYNTWVEKIKIKETIKKKRENEAEMEEEYVPIPGDPIDIKIGWYKNKKVTSVPIKRIEQGEYMFATMRISISMNSKFASNYQVKVAKTGAIFDLDDFIRIEGKKELDKLMGMKDDHELVVDESQKNWT